MGFLWTRLGRTGQAGNRGKYGSNYFLDKSHGFAQHVLLYNKTGNCFIRKSLASISSQAKNVSCHFKVLVTAYQQF